MWPGYTGLQSIKHEHESILEIHLPYKPNNGCHKICPFAIKLLRNGTGKIHVLPDLGSNIWHANFGPEKHKRLIENISKELIFHPCKVRKAGGKATLTRFRCISEL